MIAVVLKLSRDLFQLRTLRQRLTMCIALASLATGPACAQDVPLKQTFVTQLQNAVRTNDSTWLAARLRYPVRYYGHRTMVIRSKTWFIKNYASVIGAKLRAAVLAQDPGNVFENWQGLMVGEGSFNIWIRNTGEDTHERYEIITINDSE